MLKPLDHFLERLRQVTDACRVDMHEPDEQGLGCQVLGDQLDNAMTADPKNNHGEFIVGLTDADGNQEWFNLADLIAALRVCAQRPHRRRIRS